VLNSYRNETLSFSQAEIPVWIPQLVMPIGATILMLAMVAEIARNVVLLINLRKGTVLPGPGEQPDQHL
jgi:TRAP-type mannitol/chloroaromatic compound transport system permease small subunit